MDLIIVESPTKAKTIGKFVGKHFAVESSYGHIRDLPKSKVGIDVEHDFEPQYVIPLKAKPVVANLKKLAAKAARVILATDEDREGEAIAWHLASALDLTPAGGSAGGAENGGGGKNKGKKNAATPYERIAFHEITESAIKEALKNPRTLDFHLVDAQQARRVLDRLVGYGLSPFLWRKVRYGLSAGRVQSVAVRLVVERERLIKAFNKEEYWTIEATFLPPKSEKRPFPGDTVFHRRQIARQDGHEERTRRQKNRRGIEKRELSYHGNRGERGPAVSGAAVHHVHAPAGSGAQARLFGEADDGHRPETL